MTNDRQRYYSRPATDVYSRKKIDQMIDRLSRLHDLNRDKIKRLKGAITALEGLILGKMVEKEEE